MRRGGKQSSVISIEYWKSLGWENMTDIKQKISYEQKVRSPLSIDYYVKKGYSKQDAIKQICEIQSKRAKICIDKYTYEDRLNRCKWSFQYWINQGYSEEDAKMEVYKLNGMCKECYEDEDEYKKQIELHSKRQRQLYNQNPEKYWKNHLGYESREEISFFNELSKYNYDIKHLHLGINVQNTILDDMYKKQYILTDGYLKIEDELIIIEYDGLYYHDEVYDNLRDDVIFSIRPDIIGIIRVSDSFYKSNKIEQIRKEIDYAIKDIKSKKYKRKWLY
jgi:hypothetical protein